MTWQKFYEIYDLYGKDNAIWNDYLGKKETISNITNNTTNTDAL